MILTMDLYQFFGVTKKHVGVPGPLAIIFDYLMQFGHEDDGKYTLKKFPHWIEDDTNLIRPHVYLHRLATTCRFFRQFVRNWRLRYFPDIVEMEKSITTRLCEARREYVRREKRYQKRKNAKISLLLHLLDQFESGTLEAAKSTVAAISAVRGESYEPYEPTWPFEIGRVRYDRPFSSVGFENVRILNEKDEIMLEIPLQNVVKHYTAHQILRVHNQFINPKSDRFYGKLMRSVELLLDIDWFQNKNTSVNPKIRYENIGDEVVYTLYL